MNRNELEQEIKYRLEHADHDGAATAALRGYGPEIFGFLHVFHRNPQDAAEVFAIFSERLWRDLPTFRGDCTFRTWAYAVARHSALNYARDSRRRRGREEGLPEGSELSAVVDKIRSDPAYSASAVQAKLAAIREALPTDEQTLLVLRIDRNLSWNEIAIVLQDANAQPLDEAGLKQASARL